MATEIFKANGDSYDIAPAGVLILAADTFYGCPSETTPHGREHASALIDGILSAARAGGFCQEDILRTMLARRVMTPALLAMAQAACDAAGAAALGKVFAPIKKLL